MLVQLRVLIVKRFGSYAFAVFRNLGLLRVNARIVVVSRDEHVLLLGTNFHQENILPGGSVNETNEQPSAAAVRELGEEIGLWVKSEHKSLTIQPNQISQVGCYLLGQRILKHRHVFFYSCQYNASDIQISIRDSVEIKSAFWHKLDRLEQTTVSPELRYFLEQELPEHRNSSRQFIRRWMDVT